MCAPVSSHALISHSVTTATPRLPTMLNGSGDKWRMAVDQAPEQANPSTLVMHAPSAMEHDGSPDMQDEGICKQINYIRSHSEKLENELCALGLKIKHHEESIRYLKTLKSNLDESVLQMQVAMGKYDEVSLFQTKNGNPEHEKTEEQIIKNILKFENSGAACICRMTSQPKTPSSDQSLTEDVIGIVASLGIVNDSTLNRLLSEYLGQQTMLAVVCKTYEGVRALEAYNKEGSIDKNLGLHRYAASVGTPLAGRFLVICLEDIRPYAGRIIDDDPQMRLALPNPRLSNGLNPEGFLGYAVNMIIIDNLNLYCTPKNVAGLRETLFYHLFSNLQVYGSREDMLNARTCIRNGAISLDGGMMRSPGVFILGEHDSREDIDLTFPTATERVNQPDHPQAVNDLKEAKWKRDRTCEDITREQRLLSRAWTKYEIKKQEVIKYMAESSAQIAQSHRCPLVRESIPE